MLPLPRAHRRLCGTMHMSKHLDPVWLPAGSWTLTVCQKCSQIRRHAKISSYFSTLGLINCWSELGGHLVHSTPPDRPHQPHWTASARICRCHRYFGTLSERHRPESRLWGSASVCVVPAWYSGGRRRLGCPNAHSTITLDHACAPERPVFAAAGAVGTCHAERETAP